MDDPHHDLNESLIRLSDALTSQEDTVRALATLTDHVVRRFSAAEGAGVSLRASGGRVLTVGATSSDVEAADRFQHELGEGPCPDSLEEDEVVHVGDVLHDVRWPRWGRPVGLQLGFHSVLSSPLFAHGRQVGALNVYGRRVRTFGRTEVDEIPLFAAHAAACLSAVQKIEQLRSALESRTVIGQAEGIVMERYGLDGPSAFALLQRLSQHRNEKLRDVAASIVTLGSLPDDPTTTTTDPDEGHRPEPAR